MRAGVATPDGLEMRDVPVPENPGPNEVLVKVKFASLNRADLQAATGGHGAALDSVIGIEWSGEVVETGSAVTDVKPGDRVMCSGRGGYAEYAMTDIGRVWPLPSGLSFEQGATLPIALITMHNALVTKGRLKQGESVLIQGASSGVGLMGLQIAKLMGAKRVIGSSTSAERRGQLKAFGADLTVDTRDPGWSEEVLKATDGEGVDLVVDMVSGRTINATMRATKILGRIVNVGRLGGSLAEFDFNQHAQRRIDYIGVTFRTRSVEEVREISRLMRADLWDAVSAGKLSLPVARTFALDEAPTAQEFMAANDFFGKIMLKV